jgi:hypothetical protein
VANPQIIVEYVAKTTGLAAGTAQVEQGAGKLTRNLKGIAAVVGGAYATAKVVEFGKASVQAATESEQATSRLRQVFKSMGDTTGKAADAAIDYAGALSKKIGVDDEAIMASQALLATFGKVSDETARQAGIFDRATKAAADLAAAGFGSMDQNAKQLGKALQDPIKGINALARSGVTFTDTEKERIKTLVEANKVTEAQRIVLGAVEKQVGGTAEATATSQEKMAVAYDEVQESVGRGLLPILQQLSPVLISIADFTAKNTTLVLALGGAMLGAVVAIKAVTLAQTLLNVAMSANVIGLIVIGIAALIAAAILLAKNWDKVSAVVSAGFDKIKGAAVAVFNWIKANWPLLVSILGGPMVAAVVAIARNWDTISDTVRGVVSAVKSALQGLLGWLTGTFKAALGGVTHAIGAVFDFIADGARDAYAAVVRNLNGLVNFIEGIVGKVRSAASSVAHGIASPINAVLRAWNAIEFKLPKIPAIKIGKHKIGGFGGATYGVPNIPLIPMAGGAVVSAPTLAMVGEGQGREIVTPESLLRDIVGQPNVQVRVFIGATELTDIVRTEIVDANTGIARVLLAGGAG